MRLLRRQPHSGDKHEATKAREKAEVDLEHVRSQTPFYRALGEALRAVREENHLGEAIAHTFRGGKS